MGGGWRMVVMVVVVVMEIATAQVRVCPGDAPCVSFRQCRQKFSGSIQTCTGGRRELKVCCPRTIGIELPSVGGESLLPSQCRSGAPSPVLTRPFNPSGPISGLNVDRLASVSRDRPASVSRDRLASVSRDRLASVSRDRLASVSRDRPASVSRDRLASVSRDRVARVSRRRIAKRAVRPAGLEVSAFVPGNTPSVVAGQDVKLTQPFPWMAVLGYNSKTNPIWACGGSLITAQYVLTAAHCVHADHTGGLTLSVVRLGELDLSTARDCEPGTFGPVCAPIPQDFSPAQIIIHPDFNTRTSVSDDIALIRLDKKASFNNFVRPICLAAPGVGVKAALGRARNGELAGWGLNETLGGTVSVLQRALIPFVEKTKCNEHFPKLVPEQVCFGGAKQDSCQGDSGGPVFIRGSSGIRLLALVSHGLDYRCGTLGVPAVYTDVTAYRSWIVGKLEP